ncbi:MAG: hypothetical protein WAT37_04480 [Saprospiraceae bacterium]
MDTVSNIIVNEAFVKQLLPKVKDHLLIPIKFRHQLTYILGIVKDFHYSSFREVIEPKVFILDRGSQTGMIQLKMKKGFHYEAIAVIQDVYKKFAQFLPLEY